MKQLKPPKNSQTYIWTCCYKACATEWQATRKEAVNEGLGPDGLCLVYECDECGRRTAVPARSE